MAFDISKMLADILADVGKPDPETPTRERTAPTVLLRAMRWSRANILLSIADYIAISFTSIPYIVDFAGMSDTELRALPAEDATAFGLIAETLHKLRYVDTRPATIGEVIDILELKSQEYRTLGDGSIAGTPHAVGHLVARLRAIMSTSP